MRNSKAVVCLSGGADSATVLYLAVAQCTEVHAISVNYGQRHVKELECAKALCNELNIKHTIIDFKTLASFGGSPLVDSSIDVPSQSENKQTTTVVPYRNVFLTTIAAAYCQQHGLNTIYVGPTYEDLANYPDCRPEYITSIQQTLRLAGTIHDIEIRAPFISITKDRIVLLGIERLEVPYEKTWTCYKGGDKPCMECDSCKERAASFYLNGFKDPIVSDEDWTRYKEEMTKNKTTPFVKVFSGNNPRIHQQQEVVYKSIENPIKDNTELSNG